MPQTVRWLSGTLSVPAPTCRTTATIPTGTASGTRYLPFPTTHGAVFPIANGVDFAAAVRLIKEKWRRFYPYIAYYSLAAIPAAVQEGTDSAGYTQSVQQAPGQTVVDDLWGESVPAGATWIQPHSPTDSAAADAAAPTTNVYQGPFQIRAHVRINPPEQLLTRMGINETRELLVTIPTALLDEVTDAEGQPHPVYCRIGDRFVWSRVTYEAQEVILTGLWKFTDVPLYVTITAQRVHPGS